MIKCFEFHSGVNMGAIAGLITMMKGISKLGTAEGHGMSMAFGMMVKMEKYLGKYDSFAYAYALSVNKVLSKYRKYLSMEDVISMVEYAEEEFSEGHKGFANIVMPLSLTLWMKLSGHISLHDIPPWVYEDIKRGILYVIEHHWEDQENIRKYMIKYHPANLYEYDIHMYNKYMDDNDDEDNYYDDEEYMPEDEVRDTLESCLQKVMVRLYCTDRSYNDYEYTGMPIGYMMSRDKYCVKLKLSHNTKTIAIPMEDIYKVEVLE